MIGGGYVLGTARNVEGWMVGSPTSYVESRACFRGSESREQCVLPPETKWQMTNWESDIRGWLHATTLKWQWNATWTNRADDCEPRRLRVCKRTCTLVTKQKMVGECPIGRLIVTRHKGNPLTMLDNYLVSTHAGYKVGTKQEQNTILTKTSYPKIDKQSKTNQLARW